MKTRVLVILIAIVLILLVCMFYIYRENKSVVATVNGQKIYEDEYINYININKVIVAEILKMDVNDEEIWDMTINGKPTTEIVKEKALDAIISKKIQIQKAKEYGINLTDKEKTDIEGWYKRIPDDKIKKVGIDDKNFYIKIQKEYQLIKKFKNYYTNKINISEDQKRDLIKNIEDVEKQFLNKIKDTDEYSKNEKLQEIVTVILNEEPVDLSKYPDSIKNKLAELILREKYYDSKLEEWKSEAVIKKKEWLIKNIKVK